VIEILGPPVGLDPEAGIEPHQPATIEATLVNGGSALDDGRVISEAPTATGGALVGVVAGAGTARDQT